MKIRQIKGNTWVLEGMEWIPFYRLEGGRCILMDTGLGQEREDLEETLLANGLTPAGILCSHAHVDHGGSNRYFQEKYHIPVALTVREAGMCASILTLKCYFLMLPPGMVEREASNLVHTPDVIVPDRDGPFSFCGVEFQVIQTPGHSAGHISTITPDGVCYVGDALLSREQLGAKLPYCLSHQMGIDSREKLRGTQAELFVMAHRGMCTQGELEALIDDNQALARRRAEEVLAQVTQPMTMSQIVQRVCAYFQLLSHRPTRSLRFERNIRFFVEYLVDRGDLVMEAVQGVTLYRPPKPEDLPQGQSGAGGQ